MLKTARQISNEFINAQFGQPIVYYEGFLMKDVEKIVGFNRYEQNLDLIHLRDFVWNMYEEGRVCLTQRKLSKAVVTKYEVMDKEGAPHDPPIYRDNVEKEAVYQYIMTKRERARWRT